MRPVKLAMTLPSPLLPLLLAGLALAPAARADAPAVAPQEEIPEVEAGAHLKFLVNHHFARADAKARVQQLLEYWTQAFGVKNHWNGDQVKLRGHVFGVDFRARLDVTDTAVGGEATDPGALLRAAASNYVKRKLLKYLSPHYEEP